MNDFTGQKKIGLCLALILLMSDLLFNVSYAGSSTPNVFLVQPSPDSKLIPGDTAIGTWDPNGRVYTLATDVEGTIKINEDNLTLDGAGRTVIGADSGCGIYIYQRTGITIRNINIVSFDYGIYLYNSTGNHITANNTKQNSRYGICILNSNGNTISGNTAVSNNDGIFLWHSSDNVLSSNIVSENYSGINLYVDCNNNTLNANNTSKNARGIYLYNSSYNNLTDNIASSNNYYGIGLYNNNNNILTGNTSSWNRSHGIYLCNSSDNALISNTVSYNYPGIYFFPDCNNNVLSTNTIQKNYYGIYFNSNCNSNKIFRNNFIDNNTHALIHSCTGNEFNLTAPDGGNFWSGWTTPNINGDAFVDSAYIFDAGQDDLPWVRQNAWSNKSPVADAGQNHTAHPRDAVTLRGGGSSDPESDYPLTYSWQIISRPAGSAAELSASNTQDTSFTVDQLGDYVFDLQVTDSLGAQSQSDSVTISTFNTNPVAAAGADQSITQIGTVVSLNGNQSYDPENDAISYFWSITQKPSESLAELSDPHSVAPTFAADIHSQTNYIVTLTVTDEFGAVSTPDSMTVSFENIKPLAGIIAQSQSVMQGDTVTVDGSSSTDGNGDLLTYNWNFVSRPSASAAQFANAAAAQTTFVADQPGQYIVSLVVNDGFEDSNAVNVVINAISYQNEITQLLNEAIRRIRNLDPAILKNGPGTSDSLINKINVIIDMVNTGNYSDARTKLNNDVAQRTNGCADIGNPDSNDWILTCEGQNQIYPLVTQAMSLLEHLI